MSTQAVSSTGGDAIAANGPFGFRRVCRALVNELMDADVRVSEGGPSLSVQLSADIWFRCHWPRNANLSAQIRVREPMAWRKALAVPIATTFFRGPEREAHADIVTLVAGNPEGRPQWRPRRAELQPLDALSQSRAAFDATAVAKFCTAVGDNNPVHSTKSAAGAVGWRGPAVPGMLLYDHALHLLSAILESDPASVRISAVLVAPVLVGHPVLFSIDRTIDPDAYRFSVTPQQGVLANRCIKAGTIVVSYG